MPGDFVQRLEVMRLDLRDQRTTPEGGIIAKARIARTGVLEYTNADGTKRRELRLPEDVFAKTALDSFAHATVTDLHHGLITPLNWREHAIGNLAGTPVEDGEYVAADILLRHADGIRKAETGTAKEVSCGYQCRIDATPGVHPKYGAYDVRQYDITGNHVAVGPPGWGRSGSQVALRLDGGVAVSLEGGSYVPPKMAEPVVTPVAPVVTTPAAPAVTHADSDAIRGENAALKAENGRLKKEREDADKLLVSEEAQARTDAAIDARVTLIDSAKPHMDSKGAPWSHKGKSDDAIRREVLAKLEPGLELPDAKEDGADGFVAGAYRVAVARADKATTAFRNTVRASPQGGRADTRKPGREETRGDAGGTEGTGNLIADAADKAQKTAKDRWKTGGPGRDRDDRRRADRGRGAR
jgi:uncharacterized protein